MRLVHYAVAALAIRLADMGARVALTLLAVERAGGAAAAGVLVAALLVPHVVAAPVAGLLSDRARRPQLVTAAAALVLAGALTVAAVGTGALPLAAVAGALLLAGCSGPLLTGGLTSRLGEIVPPDRLPRAFGVDSATYGVAGLAGPALAAAVAAVWSAAAATGVLAALAVLGAVVVASLPMRSGAPDGSPVRLRDGAAAITRSRGLSVVTATTTVGDVPTGMLPVAAVLVAEAAGFGDAAGWLVTAVAGGALVGSVVWTIRPAGADRALQVLALSQIATAVPLAVAALLPMHVVAVGVLFALSGVAQGPLVGAMFTARQAYAPPAVRGQVFTTAAGLRTTAEALGAGLAGLLAGFGPTVVLGVATAFPLVAAGGGLAGPRRAQVSDQDSTDKSRGTVGAQR
ncbi:MFS transporter [Pseudonocardia sp. CA-107938]|uniref:MFS transporter n=1 Tax=Pseudonocardia sp. CA-107938 TaxID=3240021 RepID=UPI003D8C184C